MKKVAVDDVTDAIATTMTMMTATTIARRTRTAIGGDAARGMMMTSPPTGGQRGMRTATTIGLSASASESVLLSHE